LGPRTVLLQQNCNSYTVLVVMIVLSATTVVVVGASAEVMKQLQAELIRLGGTVAKTVAKSGGIVWT
jgi:hypothetical protein